jgi:hypothetical protein
MCGRYRLSRKEGFVEYFQDDGPECAMEAQPIETNLELWG